MEARPLVAAVDTLRELYARGGRKVPEGPPTEFVPTRWRGCLDQAAKAGNTTAYRHYWELCTLLGLRDALRSRDVWVPGSRRYSDPTTLLLPAEKWNVPSWHSWSLPHRVWAGAVLPCWQPLLTARHRVRSHLVNKTSSRSPT